MRGLHRKPHSLVNCRFAVTSSVFDVSWLTPLSTLITTFISKKHLPPDPASRSSHLISLSEMRGLCREVRSARGHVKAYDLVAVSAFIVL